MTLAVRPTLTVCRDAGEHAALLIGESAAGMCQAPPTTLDVSGIAEGAASLEEQERDARLVERHLLRVRPRPVSRGAIAKEPAVAGILKMQDDRVERHAHDALDDSVPSRAPVAEQQRDRF